MSEQAPAERQNGGGFTTKEMLVRLETVVDRIEQKLDAKAEKRDLDALEIRIVAVEAASNLRLLSLEQITSSGKALESYKRWLIGAVFTAAIVATGMIALIVTSHR